LRFGPRQRASEFAVEGVVPGVPKVGVLKRALVRVLAADVFTAVGCVKSRLFVGQGDPLLFQLGDVTRVAAHVFYFALRDSHGPRCFRGPHQPARRPARPLAHDIGLDRAMGVTARVVNR
jgi:hypothetical protein